MAKTSKKPIRLYERDTVLPDTWNIINPSTGATHNADLLQLVQTMNAVDEVVLMRYDEDANTIYFTSIPQEFDV